MSRLLGVLVVLAAGWFAMPLLISQNDGGAEEQGGFASDRDPAKTAKPIEFDGKRAMGYLEAICEIGPRMSGTAGMQKQQELIVKHFEKLGEEVQFQKFTAKQVSRPKEPVEMANLIVSYHPDRKRRVILCSHYDTRPIADQEKDERKWREKFVSANDGGSGVALLMELANHMKDLPTKVGVDFVFFDGEEYIFEPGRDKYFFGSEHFAKTWKQTKGRPDYTAAVLFDMIAGGNAKFPVEGHSWFRCKSLCQELWGTARELKCRAFVEHVGDHVQDDHLALQNVGIPAVDIIDFSYPHWHKLSDVPANCSPEGMAQVAKVVSVWLQRVR
jgi:hypothetical protein